MTRRRISLLAGLGYILLPVAARATAWTQPVGNLQLIIGSEYYHADSVFDAAGNRQAMAPYSRYDISPYLEYGWSENITLGGKTTLTYAQQKSARGQQSNQGIGESELFARFQLYRTNHTAISLQPMIKLPSPDSRDEQPLLGGPRADIGLGGSLGRKFSLFEREHFTVTEIQYRHRFGPQSDQVRVNLTAGITLSDDWLLLPQSFVTLRTKQEVNQFTFSNSDDYDQYRLQLSARYRIDEGIHAQFGGYADVAGQNIGVGRGAILALWLQY